jgi:hypothetical protein
MGGLLLLLLPLPPQAERLPIASGAAAARIAFLIRVLTQKSYGGSGNFKKKIWIRLQTSFHGHPNRPSKLDPGR